MKKDIKAEAEMLRQKAEEMLKKNPEKTGLQISEAENLKLIHELEILRIELELQNEELIQANEQALDKEKKSSELFENVPSGLFKLTKEGEIINLNFRGSQLLGKERSLLINSSFVFFVSNDTKPIFNLFLAKVFNSNAKETCDVTLSNKANSPVYVNLSGVTIENGKQCLVIMVDNTERKIVEDELRKSEARFRSYLELPLHGVAITSPDKGLLHVNDRICSILGYSKDELIRMTWAEITHLDDIALDVEQFNRVLSGEIEQYTFEKRFIRKDDRIIWARIAVGCVRKTDGKVDYLIGLLEDVTERKCAEEKVKLFSSAVESAYDGIIIADLNGNINYANASAIKSFGYTQEELNKLNVVSLNADPNMAKEMTSKVLSQGNWSGEIKSAKKNGEEFPTILSISVVKDGGGMPISLMGIFRDMTERKKSFDSLKQAYEELENLYDNLDEAIYSVDVIHNNFIQVSPAHKAVFGYSPEEFFKNPMLWYEIVVPEDKPIIDANYSVLYAGNTLHQEFRILHPDGQIRWIEAKIKPTLDENGKLIRADGIATDITDRKKVEEELRQSKIELSTLMDNLKGIVYSCLYDKDWTMEFVSEGLFDLTGYLPDELIENKTISYEEIIHPDDRKMVHVNIQNFIEKKAAYVLEYRIITKSGSVKHVWERGQGLFTSNGTLHHLEGFISDITERVQANEALMISEMRYRRLFESAKDGILLIDEKTGMITDVNPYLIEMLGYSREQFIEKAIWEIGSFKDIVSNQDKFLELKQKEYVTYEDLSLETADRRKINVELISNVYAVNHHKVIQCNIRDITKRIRAEEQLKNINERFELATNVAEISVWELDLNTKEINKDDNFNKIFGIVQGNYQIEFNEFIKFVHPDDVEIIGNNFKEAYESDGNMSYEFRIIRPGGEIRNIRAYSKMLKDKANKPIKCIGINSDITEDKKAELELKKAKEQAEESDRLKSAFLANMSHEIRTPMNGILGFAGLLKEPKLTGEEQKEYIEIIEKSGVRMLNIINDIINISKVESGQMQVSITETNVNEQIEYIYTFFKPEAEQKGIQISYKNPLSAREAVIQTDREKVYAVLTNLVKNAIKFTRKGSVELGYEKKAGAFEFYVRDTGRGIPPDQCAIIFERFRQVDDSLHRKFEGAGLGLSISKAYVELLGGKIWVESQYKVGSVFYFTLPSHVQAKEESPINIKVLPDNGIENNVKGLKILIAEDDELSTVLLMKTMKTYTREILKVRNGFEAVETSRKNPDLDLILMDIQMPQIDGYQATREIRQFNKDVIIIAQTAFALSGDREKAIESGCNDYIAKPIDKTLLNELVKKYFLKYDRESGSLC